MLVYDSQLPVLDSDFKGDEVALLAVDGRYVDPSFRANYAQAVALANAGKLSKITVVVRITGETVLHTVGAVESALFGQPLHGNAAFLVDAERDEFGAKVGGVLEGLKALAPVTEAVKPVEPTKPVAPTPPKRPEPVKPVDKGASE